MNTGIPSGCTRFAAQPAEQSAQNGQLEFTGIPFPPHGELSEAPLPQPFSHGWPTLAACACPAASTTASPPASEKVRMTARATQSSDFNLPNLSEMPLISSRFERAHFLSFRLRRLNLPPDCPNWSRWIHSTG